MDAKSLKFMQFADYLRNKKTNPRHNATIHPCWTKNPETMNSKCGQAVEIYNDGMVIPVINYLLRDLEGGPIDEKLE